ncbi:MAG: DNA mismatch repair protein MutS [Alphaproteobacteria bacterium]|jgi:DNA-nicking Smr family endonuclease|nr:DNA mismatch repair protein MutS [Alphaproteobacteria bacterium]
MTSGGTEDGEDDDDLFRRVLRDAKPIRKGRPVPEHPAVKAGKKITPKTPQAKKAHRIAPRPVVAAPPPKPARELATGDYTGMDRRTAERFRRGKLPIEGRLDLHGMYQDAAHHALTDFVTSSAAMGKRNVLVITGRGSREGSGVLRERLPQWLNQPPCRDLVVAFTGARPEHGRDGAFYVLLRRRRDRDT